MATSLPAWAAIAPTRPRPKESYAPGTASTPCWIAASPMRLGMPEGMRIIDLVIIGFVAAIGFTVSLFVASVAFDAGPVQDAAKMGALLSFGAAIISIIAGRVLRVKKIEM